MSKSTRIVLLVVANFALQSHGVCASEGNASDTSGQRQFAAYVKKELDRLGKTYPSIKEALKGRGDAVKDCKTTIRRLLNQGKDGARRQILTDKFSENLTESDTFRFHEYYIMWLGGRQELFKGRNDKKLIYAFVKKVNNRDKIQVSVDVRNEWCLGTIEVLLSMVEYKSKASFQAGELRVNWDEWKRFSNWLSTNRDRLNYDKQLERFRVGE